MASVPQRKISQVKGPAKKTTFYLTSQEREDDKSEDEKAPALKPKFNCVAKKIIMVNRAFPLPVQRKVSVRANLGSQNEAAAGRYGTHVNSSLSDCGESSRSNGTELMQKENTYRMEPDGKFMPEKTKNIMEKILKSRLEGITYSTAEGKNLCVLLSDEIKAAVRVNALLDRHKLVCVVYIGQVLGQGVHITSRCLWNAKFDAFSSATFKNDNLFAQASVFTVYVE